MTKNNLDAWNTYDFTGTENDYCYFKTDLIAAGSHFKDWTDPLDHTC